MIRRTKPMDSLELLLDTMCNTFGGIILIALLVALLARDVESKIDSATQGSSQTRVEQTQKDLQAAQALEQTLQAELASLRQSPEAAAARQLSALQEKYNQASDRQNAAKAAAAAARSPAAAVALIQELEKQLLEFQEKEAALAATTAQAGNELGAVQSQITKAQNELAAASASRAHEIRPLDSHLPTQAEVYFILKFGAVYPVHVPSGSQMVQNTSGLRWEKNNSQSEDLIPIQGKGWKIPEDNGNLLALISRLDLTKHYAALFVYADSFDIFHDVKNLFVDRGFLYGVQPLRNDDPVRTGGNSRLPAQ